MKKRSLITLAALGLVFATALPSQAHVRGRIWIGPGWGPWWGAPYPYSYYAPPVVIQQQPPPVYVEPAPREQEEQNYWYYCQEPQGYYPYVKQCPGGWLKVVPKTTPPNEEE